MASSCLGREEPQSLRRLYCGRGGFHSPKNLYTPNTGGAGWIECECDNSRNNRHLKQRMDGSGTTVPTPGSGSWTLVFGLTALVFGLLFGTGWLIDGKHVHYASRFVGRPSLRRSTLVSIHTVFLLLSFNCVKQRLILIVFMLLHFLLAEICSAIRHFWLEQAGWPNTGTPTPTIGCS